MSVLVADLLLAAVRTLAAPTLHIILNIALGAAIGFMLRNALDGVACCNFSLLLTFICKKSETDLGYLLKRQVLMSVKRQWEKV